MTRKKDFPETCSGEPRREGIRFYGSVRTADVADLVNPTVGNFECEEGATGTEDAEDFAESSILRTAGLEMVEHENRDRRRKGF